MVLKIVVLAGEIGPSSSGKSTRGTANLRKRPDEPAERGPLPFVLYLAKTTHDVEQHTLVGKQLGCVRLETFEEVLKRRIRSLRDVIEPTSRHAVDAVFILIDLLVRHVEQFSELLQRQTKHHPTFADPRAD